MHAEERQVQLARKQAEVIANVIMDGLRNDDLGLSEQQLSHARVVAAHHLRLVSADEGREELFGDEPEPDPS